ncbi:Panacea domain-containing protein [Demequina sediminicola]|uniref:Panacea domain-containing protein n=1 Tax=Demequina sediminicola TaxID=1095026 RepID=UPI00078130F9|nr:type II toxin-antitoxin system antitoxin SocA domain-containing protein [Demequina sediminicola]
MTGARDLDVAQRIYDELGWVDSWKLQKLTYYTQAWSLAWTGTPLFEGRIEAWKDGPVAPALFRVNKYNRAHFHDTYVPGSDTARLSSDGLAIVDEVVRFYGGFDKPALVNLTHGERPWKSAYQRGKNSLIESVDMYRFYSELAEIGGAVPSRPELSGDAVDEAEFEAAFKAEMPRWTRTLERLAQ